MTLWYSEDSKISWSARLTAWSLSGIRPGPCTWYEFLFSNFSLVMPDHNNMMDKNPDFVFTLLWFSASLEVCRCVFPSHKTPKSVQGTFTRTQIFAPTLWHISVHTYTRYQWVLQGVWQTNWKPFSQSEHGSSTACDDQDLFPHHDFQIFPSQWFRAMGITLIPA